METVKHLEEEFIREYIEETLHLNLCDGEEIIDGKYHHNSDYDNAPSILKNNILSIRRLHQLGLVDISDNQLQLLDDITSHANGIDGISLSVVGLDDLYKDEDEYNPFHSGVIDYVISDEVKARRYTENYGNEYIARGEILLSCIRTIDFRLIKFMKHNIYNEQLLGNVYDNFIRKYNTIIYTARKIAEKELPIQIREMSYIQKSLDVESMAKHPYLVKVKRKH